VQVIEFNRTEEESLADVEAMLEGRVFHVTRRPFWEAIVTSGEIRPNADGCLPTTFGSSSNSFFKNRGCVSIFDYRSPADETIREFRMRCWPFQPAMAGGEGIAVLILKVSTYGNLVPWTKWKEENALREMVVPYVEAGHPGPIPLSEIEQVILLHVAENPTSLSARLRRARDDKKS